MLHDVFSALSAMYYRSGNACGASCYYMMIIVTVQKLSIAQATTGAMLLSQNAPNQNYADD